MNALKSIAIDKAIDGLKVLSITIIDSSYVICLTVAMIGLIVYMAGYKKGAKAVTLSLITHFVLQAVKLVI
ncbi:MAG: hypothetical protein RSA29_02520 [Clostridium sp.]|uniref:hypothetical protein n=1 Tax=Clostridium sp. TaxID=1506 RepID=UPI0030721D16